MLRRIVFLVLLSAIPWAAEAQNNNLTLLLGGASFRSTDIATFAPQDFERTVEMEKGGAAGIS